MSKITIIQLLNKIANNEGVPKKIKYEKHIYEYEEGTYDWSYYVQNNGTVKFLLTDIFNSDDNILTILNEEVEIIEEEKGIPGKINIFKDDDGMEYVAGNNCEKISYSPEDLLFANKINEIIDYLQSKGE